MCMRAEYEPILRKICEENDMTMSIISSYYETNYYLRFKDADECLCHIFINWITVENTTLFSVLSFTKAYLEKYLMSKNYDWSVIMKYFTKKDLKNGDVVVLRDYTRGIVIKDLDALITEDLNTMSLRYTDYDDNLTRAGHTGKASMDIMKVYRPDNYIGCTFDHDNEFLKNSKLIYERKEVEEMTLEEICKALGKEIKIVKEK